MAPLSRFRRVVMLTPAGATGGPEAIHQLAYSLNSLGIDCRIAYYGSQNKVHVAGHRILCQPADCPSSMETYREYRPQVAAEIVLDSETLVILPEVATAQHGVFRNCGVAIWWLSVDFAVAQNPALNDPKGRAELFQRDNLIHLYQSVYAREWLRQSGARNLFDLGDYTNQIYLGPEPSGPSPRPAVAFNLRKGASSAEQFFAQHPQFDALGLRGFTKAQLRDIFAERLLYVDCGHFPGKDRMPREAAACGSIVFVHRHGAGCFYDDFPLPDFFKFTLDDLSSGDLARRMDEVIADPRRYWAEQVHFRALIGWEKAQFHDQVMRLWGIKRML